MEHTKLISAVFITFSGNCKKALTFYQSCFGGTLQFEMLGEELQGYTEKPVLSGSLMSERVVIYGSDLVHDEGRKPGNHMSIFLQCHDTKDRTKLVRMLQGNSIRGNDDRKLIEVKDAFDVGWVLGV